MCTRCKKSQEALLTQGRWPVCSEDGAGLVVASEYAEDDPLLGHTIEGRFLIVGRLGAGSMGTVYRAWQDAMGRQVAVKVLRSDKAFDEHAKARFAREARAMSLLRSPHTVTVFDFGEINTTEDERLKGSLYLAMELLEGESLGHRIRREGRLPVFEAARIARDALLSLVEAHGKGIVHRDLKPDNLFLVHSALPGAPPLCKVLDFGIAKVLSGGLSDVDAVQTQVGTVFGTPRYMSPEQAQGRALDARSDVYSFGVILYQMLVGKPPFMDDDAVVVMARHIKSPPVPPALAAPDAEIPAPLNDLVLRALEKDPAKRPANARAMLDELEVAQADAAFRSPTALSSVEMAAAVLDEWSGGSEPARRRRRALGAGLVTAAAMAIAVIAVVRGGPMEAEVRGQRLDGSVRAASLFSAVLTSQWESNAAQAAAVAAAAEVEAQKSEKTAVPIKARTKAKAKRQYTHFD